MMDGIRFRQRPAAPMTVGQLSHRTGVPIKTLRQYADWGLVYTLGRSPANYRLFGSDALWCVHWIGILRGLGLRVAEIRDLTAAEHTGQPTSRPMGPLLAERLRAARARVEASIAELERVRRRIEEFQTTHAAELAGAGDRLQTADPAACCCR